MPVQADLLIAQFHHVVTLTSQLGDLVSDESTLSRVRKMQRAAEDLNDSAIAGFEEFLREDSGLDTNFGTRFGDLLHDLANHLGKVSMGCQSLLRKVKEQDDWRGIAQRLHRFCGEVKDRMQFYGKQVDRRASRQRSALTGAQTIARTEDGPEDSEPFSVAVVEDDETYAAMVTEHLSDVHGFTVECFRDGESLLKRLAEQSFDLVLLDVMLPGMSGDVVLDHILGDRKLSSTPVLMMSGVNDPTLILQCLERGAVDFLPKPVEYAVLDARVRACKNLKRVREMDYRRHFTSELAAELSCDPQKLEDRDAHISVLFCDIRGFSAITGRLETPTIVGWVRETMHELSRCVFEHHGTLVDYAGDGLMAMWGAPADQGSHASLALTAAFDMQDVIHRLAEEWEQRLGERFQVGIGINSGTAHVGVVGRFPKFKYGPLGADVNVASRVEGMTKLFNVPVLVTDKTNALLPDQADCARRRLCSVQLANIAQPVPLYEVCKPSTKSADLFQRYQDALQDYESQRLNSAAERLGTLFSEWPDDGPTRLLLGRTLDALVSGEHQTVWKAPGK